MDLSTSPFKFRGPPETKKGFEFDSYTVIQANPPASNGISCGKKRNMPGMAGSTVKPLT